METIGENCVVTISFWWEDLVVPSIRKEPKAFLSKIKVVYPAYTPNHSFFIFFSNRVLKISQQLKALFG